MFYLIDNDADSSPDHVTIKIEEEILTPQSNTNVTTTTTASKANSLQFVKIAPASRSSNTNETTVTQKTNFVLITTPSPSISQPGPSPSAKNTATTPASTSAGTACALKQKAENDNVSRKLFDEQLNAIYGNRSARTSKPQWTQERINNVIKYVEEFEKAKKLNKPKTSAQYYSASKYEVIAENGKKSLIHKRKSAKDQCITKIVASEDYYDILSKAHIDTGHGGRDKMLRAIKPKMTIPTSAICLYAKLCKICMNKKSWYTKQIDGNMTDILMNRAKVDFIDMNETPDGDYKWILHYQDCATKFSLMRSLMTVDVDEVASELLKIFLEIGCPNILLTEFDREFTSCVINKVQALWPACKILNGQPKDEDLDITATEKRKIEEMVRNWMQEKNSNNWAIGIHFAQFKRNTSMQKPTPFLQFFGKAPKNGLKHALPQNILASIHTEEDLEKFLNMDNEENDIEEAGPDQLYNTKEGTENQIISTEIKEELEEYQNTDPLECVEREKTDYLTNSPDQNDTDMTLLIKDEVSMDFYDIEIEPHQENDEEGVQSKRMKV